MAMAQQKPADGLQNLSLCETAELIKGGEVSATEVLEACFAQIDQIEPIHHAFVWQDRESAVDRARWLDSVRSRGETVGPLHGVPMAHKDMYYQAGKLSTCGSALRRDFRPTVTATVTTMTSVSGTGIRFKVAGRTLCQPGRPPSSPCRNGRQAGQASAGVCRPA